MKESLAHEQLLRILSYDETTGQFRWMPREHPKFSGKIAGTIRPNGYLQICVRGKFYFAHRLAWFYVHGEWPKHTIDHINGIPTDNRITNLRDVTMRINCQNKHNSKGVRLLPRGGRYQAIIGHFRKQISLGTFDTFDEAHSAYVSAKRSIHPGCTV